MSLASFYELYENEVINTTFLKPGAIISCRDTANLYIVPTTGGKAVKMTETTRFLTESERSNITPINCSKYFCYDTGKMWIYYNEWICINPDIERSEFDIENVVLTNRGSVDVNDSRITSSCTGIFIPDLSVIDLINDISVTCLDGYAVITGITSYDIPGTLKIK